VSKRNSFVFTVFIRRVGRTDNSLPNEFTYYYYYDDDDNDGDDGDDDDDNSVPFSF
jgi:hypothetical protein